ncbi:MAG: hypothetical protein HUU08_14895 [Candidatus Brocadia sp.]|nr:hypothetical protein [Candidatus Brocadia sp.]UJS18664.1 MAG: hypothetical protein L3J17_06310 [Candidatus Jettenia sp.]
MNALQGKTHLRLATKFNLLTIGLILFTAAGISIFLIRSQILNSYRNLLNHGLSVAAVISQNSEYGIYTEDKESIRQIVKSLAVDADIAYVCLIRRNESWSVRISDQR